MAVDHTRPLPVSPERLEAVCREVYCIGMKETTEEQMANIYKLAMQGEQIEWLQQVSFFLSEAYDIYNARFR